MWNLWQMLINITLSQVNYRKLVFCSVRYPLVLYCFHSPLLFCSNRRFDLVKLLIQFPFLSQVLTTSMFLPPLTATTADCPSLCLRDKVNTLHLIFHSVSYSTNQIPTFSGNLLPTHWMDFLANSDHFPAFPHSLFHSLPTLFLSPCLNHSFTRLCIFLE